jgi:Uma2 family endonuclease
MTQSHAGTTVELPPTPEQGPGIALPLVLDFSAVEMSDDQFVQFCADNRELRIELTAAKELIVMPPANPVSGIQNSALNAKIYNWSILNGSGVSFDSSSGFTLPNGAVRSPDASWMSRERWDALPDDDKLRFSHIAPDFVVELRSPSDTVAMLQAKMAEYIQNGVQLGWLIDPLRKQVHIYRSGQPVEVLDGPEIVSGDPVLPGFVLNLQEIW